MRSSNERRRRRFVFFLIMSGSTQIRVVSNHFVELRLVVRLLCLGSPHGFVNGRLKQSVLVIGFKLLQCRHGGVDGFKSVILIAM